MKLINKYTKSIILSAILVVALISCGDSTRNDQGVSFTLLGWFQDATGSTGASGFTIPLSSSSSEVGGEVTDLLSFIGVQNHLSGQTIRVQRVQHSYAIPGARISIPSTAVVFSTVLPPTGAVDDTFNSDSTLPDSHGGAAGTGGAGGTNATAQVNYGQMAVVPSSIRSYLNLNRNSLPELPFTMIVRSYAVGITSAGHTITSNDFETQVYVTADVPIPPTSGAGVTTGLTNTNTNPNFQLDSLDTEF